MGTFLIAFLYSSVGHGGASGYLAILSLLDFPYEQRGTSALCLNLLVAGLAFYSFWKAGHFSWKFTWPFMAASIPLAFVGGFLKVSPPVYEWLLAGSLLVAGLRLLINLPNSDQSDSHGSDVTVILSLLIGGVIGLISGIVGVGGGIFLSPLLILLYRVNPKTVAASSAFFILVNSASGLLGRAARAGIDLPVDIGLMVGIAFLGAAAGAHLGARHFSGLWLKRILAVVLFVAAIKVVIA